MVKCQWIHLAVVAGIGVTEVADKTYPKLIAISLFKVMSNCDTIACEYGGWSSVHFCGELSIRKPGVNLLKRKQLVNDYDKQILIIIDKINLLFSQMYLHAFGKNPPTKTEV